MYRSHLTLTRPARRGGAPALGLGLGLALLLASSLGGCATPKGNSVAEKQAAVMTMHDQVVEQLSIERAGFNARIRQAPGYAVFSNVSTKILFFGSGNGYGVVVNNESKDKTFMRMAEFGAGIGVGIKDWRAVFVFNNSKAMYLFLQDGWEFGGDADAAFKIGDGGGQASDGFSANDVDVYQFTEQGVTLAAMLNGTKYWRDDKLNDPAAPAAPTTPAPSTESTTVANADSNTAATTEASTNTGARTVANVSTNAK